MSLLHSQPERPDGLLHAACPGVPPSFPAACAAQGLCEGALYGLFWVGNRRSLARLRSQLRLLVHIAEQATPAPAASSDNTPVVICPNCGQPIRLERVLLAHNRGPPSDADSIRGEYSACADAV
jgi:hypothetical protein